ncbi:MAG: hypothetical protein U0573_14340 [Phycisphaerales bacterium]|nr:hypothetical protein [Planctomycetota bacterium]
MSAKKTNTSFLIGLAISAAAHIAALYSLQLIKIDPLRSRVSLASMKALSSLPSQKQDEKNNPEKPEEKKEDPDHPRPPQDMDQDIRFGIDNSTNQTKTWLGFLEGDSSTGLKGDVAQAAMALDPGEPGAAGSPLIQPTPPSPAAATPPSLPLPPQNPPTPEPKPAEANPEKQQTPAPAPSAATPPVPAAASGVSGPASDSKDPLLDRVGASGNSTGKNADDSKGKDNPDAAPPKEPVAEKPDAKPGESREGQTRPDDTEKKSELNDKGADAAETKPVSPATELLEKLTREVIPTPTPPAPPTPAAETPPPPTPPAQTPAQSAPQEPTPSSTPEAGGNGKMRGIRSDRESEAVTNKIVDVHNRDGRVAAGRGLNIQTRRAEFTNTTLLTSPPRDTLVRISFRKDGEVKRAQFVEGTATGNPNVDDPLLNAIYRWRASGNELKKLGDADTLSVTVRVTFK